MRLIYLSRLIGGIFILCCTQPVLAADLEIIQVCPTGCASPPLQWLAIRNQGLVEIDITQWRLQEGGSGHKIKSDQGSSLLLSQATAIVAQDSQAFVAAHPEVGCPVVDSSWSTLKKAGEQLGLRNQSNELVASVLYKPVEQEILPVDCRPLTSESEGELGWIEKPDLVKMVEEKKKDSRTSEEDFGSTSLTSITTLKVLPPSSSVLIKGVVASLPGTLYKTIVYLLDDKGVGVPLYLANKKWPEFQLGSVVEVMGEVVNMNGKLRLKVKKEEGIKMGTDIRLPLPFLHLALSELEERLIGCRLLVVGEVTESRKNSFVLDDGTGEIRVVNKQTSRLWSKPMIGDQVSVIGLLEFQNNEYGLWVQDHDELKIQASMPSGVPPENKVSSSSVTIGPPPKETEWEFLIAAMGTILGVKLVGKRSRQRVVDWLKLSLGLN